MATNVPSEFKDNLQVYLDDGYKLGGGQYKHINNWTHLSIQLMEARCFLEIAEKNFGGEPDTDMDKILMQQALFRSFTLAYGKCFTSGGRGRTKLEKEDIFSTNPDLKVIHDRIMDIRHKFSAHSDINDLEMAILVIKETSEGIDVRQTYTLALPVDEFSDFQMVISHVETLVIHKRQKAVESIESKSNKPMWFR